MLHRREIVRREGIFAVLENPIKAALFDANLLSLFEKLPYLVYTATIDKRAHLERYSVWHFDPYHYCLRCLVERYVLWLNRHDLTGDVIVEPRFKKADKRLKESFRAIYETGTEHIPVRTVQRCLTSRELKFEKKDANIAGLQICDLLAYPSYRHMKNVRLEIAQPEDFGTTVTNILLEKKYGRHPKSRAIDGIGRKWLP